jgi:hypothetical protein
MLSLLQKKFSVCSVLTHMTTLWFRTLQWDSSPTSFLRLSAAKSVENYKFPPCTSLCVQWPPVRPSIRSRESTPPFPFQIAPMFWNGCQCQMFENRPEITWFTSRANKQSLWRQSAALRLSDSASFKWSWCSVVTQERLFFRNNLGVPKSNV